VRCISQFALEQDMDRITGRVDAWLIALAFAVAMRTSWGPGRRLGRRWPLEPGEDPGTKFIDATLTIARCA